MKQLEVLECAMGGRVRQTDSGFIAGGKSYTRECLWGSKKKGGKRGGRDGSPRLRYRQLLWGK